MSKIIKCKTCQTEIASDAKTCPKCGAPNKKKGCMTYILYVVGGLFGLGILGAITNGGSKKSGSSSSSVSTPTEKAVLNVRANDLVKAYESNEVAADEKYKGKLVKVSGRIESIGKDLLDNPYVVLGGEGMLDGVQCTFPDKASSRGELAKLNKGESVNITGVCEGLMGNVHVKVR